VENMGGPGFTGLRAVGEGENGLGMGNEIEGGTEGRDGDVGGVTGDIAGEGAGSGIVGVGAH
jgi:hypothetical protein